MLKISTVMQLHGVRKLTAKGRTTGDPSESLMKELCWHFRLKKREINIVGRVVSHVTDLCYDGAMYGSHSYSMGTE